MVEALQDGPRHVLVTAAHVVVVQLLGKTVQRVSVAPEEVDARSGLALAGVPFRVVKSQAADRDIDDFMTVPRSRPG
jgi:hypothetical protein